VGTTAPRGRESAPLALRARARESVATPDKDSR
jgi:hypothetical protein